ERTICPNSVDCSKPCYRTARSTAELFVLLTVSNSACSARQRNRELARVGFEPPVELPPQWFSRPPPSTTRPSLRVEKSRQNSRNLGHPGFRTKRPSVR